MISCFACGNVVRSNRALFNHLTLHHSHLKIFRCIDESCGRSYSSLNSFAKHRRLKHSDRDESRKNKITTKLQNLNMDLFELPSTNRSFDPLTDGLSKNVTVNAFVENALELPNDSDKVYIENSDSDAEFEPLEIPLQTPPVRDSDSNSKTHSSHLRKKLTERASKFVSKMFSFSEIPRKTVQAMLSEVSTFVNDILESIETEITVEAQSSENSSTEMTKVIDVIQSFSNPLADLKTESQQIKYFRNVGTFIAPQQFAIGERPEFRQVAGIQTVKHVKVTAEFVPLRKLFKQFFELPNVLIETLDYLKQLQENTEIISNFVQGSFWRKKVNLFKEKIVLPLFLYFDDYQNNNPLGSHKGIGKCGAVYVTIPCLPPTYQSKLENIFLFLLFNSLDRETFGNNIIFSKVVEELNFLQQTGVDIICSGQSFRLHFQLASIIGDNLRIHSILGFVEGFRANFFCRFCLTHKSQINAIIDEKQSELRNATNYQAAVTLDDLSKTGVKENCIFHEVEHFHVTLNLGVDVMHDLLEGICPYDISKILRHFIYSLKLFSLNELNNRVQAFYYGPGESNNKPAEICENHLKENNRLAMSSAEMLNFVRHICLILGHVVPEENEHWELLKLLKIIIEIVCSTSVADGTHNYLKIVITEYLEMYGKLFPNSMKPKHHFLVHYSRIMQDVGVLWKICSMRYESKHREGKKTAKSAISRLNVCRTIALREQLRVNYRFLCRQTSYSYCEIGSTSPAEDTVLEPWLPQLREVFSSTQNYFTAQWIKYLGRKAIRNSVLYIPCAEGPLFYIIDRIIVDDKQTIVLITKQLNFYNYNSHTQAFKICDMNNFQWTLLFYDDLRSATITYVNKMSDGFYYINKRWI